MDSGRGLLKCEVLRQALGGPAVSSTPTSALCLLRGRALLPRTLSSLCGILWYQPSPPLVHHSRDAASASGEWPPWQCALRAETWGCAFPASFSLRRMLCGRGRRQHAGLYLLALRFSALHLSPTCAQMRQKCTYSKYPETPRGYWPVIVTTEPTSGQKDLPFGNLHG